MKQLPNEKNPLSLVEESWEEQRAAKRYNPAMVACWRWKRKDYRMTVGAGRSDDISFFIEGNEMICVSINYQLDYVGIQVYSMEHEDDLAELFLQGDEQIKEILGRDWENRTPRHVARVLWSHLSQCV